MWCLTNAPLLIATDVASLASRPDVLATLSNTALVAINQDAGAQGVRMSPRNESGVEVWVKYMSDGSVAVAFLNKAADTLQHTLVLKDVSAAGG